MKVVFTNEQINMHSLFTQIKITDYNDVFTSGIEVSNIISKYVVMISKLYSYMNNDDVITSRNENLVASSNNLPQ